MPPAAQADSELSALIGRYYDALATGDWSALAAQFWPGCAIVTLRPRQAGGPEEVVSVRVEDYVAEARRNVVRVKPLEFPSRAQRIERTGPVAQAQVVYQASDTSGDIPQTWQASDFFTFVRHGDTWRIAALVVSPDTTAP